MATTINFVTKVDPRGALTIVEKELPFKIERVFYIYDVKSRRGGHGHLFNRMLLVALKGSLVVQVNNGKTKDRIKLNKPDVGLYLEPGDWHVLDDFSEDAILLVLCSHSYDPDDYFYEEPVCSV